MAEDQDPDRELLEAARNGPDREWAFRELYQIYVRAIDEFFRRKGYSPQEREDLIQETFLRAFKEVILREISFREWLFLMASHVHRDEIRRRRAGIRKGKTISFDSSPAGSQSMLVPLASGDPQEEALGKDRAEMVRRALLEFPPKMRNALQMYLRGDKIREIALAMGITQGAVKAHLHQARQRLRDELGPHFEEPGF